MAISCTTYIAAMRAMFAKRFSLFNETPKDRGFDNNVALNFRNAAGTADVETVKLNGSNVLVLGGADCAAILLNSAGPVIRPMSIPADPGLTDHVLTAAEVLNTVLTHTPTGAANDQMPTAAAIVAAIPGCQINSSFRFVLRNTSAGANTITVTTNTNTTLAGTMTVAQNAVREFVGIVTNVTTPAVTLFSLGSGAF